METKNLFKRTNSIEVLLFLFSWFKNEIYSMCMLLEVLLHTFALWKNIRMAPKTKEFLFIKHVFVILYWPAILAIHITDGKWHLSFILLIFPEKSNLANKL